MNNYFFLINTTIILICICITYKTHGQTKHYNIEGSICSYESTTYTCVNQNGIEEKLTIIIQCLADCGWESVYYESSFNPGVKIKLILLEDIYTTNSKCLYKVSFPNDHQTYLLEWRSWNDQITRCYNPDNSIQIFKSSSSEDDH